MCNISLPSSQLTHAVISLKMDKGDVYKSIMKLNQNFRRGTKYNYSVCIENGLFGSISPSWFVQWVEANVIFGAEKIILHNLTKIPSLVPYIEHYSKLGLIDVLPWTWPHNVKGEKLIQLQHAVIFDCQYRLQGLSR